MRNSTPQDNGLSAAHSKFLLVEGPLIWKCHAFEKIL